MGTAGILGGWALQGYFAVGHCRDTWWLGTSGILGGWALQGYFAVGHCRDTWWLGTAGILCGWALQGYLVVGTAGILCGWSLKSASGQPHCEGGELRTSMVTRHRQPASIDSRSGDWWFKIQDGCALLCGRRMMRWLWSRPMWLLCHFLS